MSSTTEESAHESSKNNSVESVKDPNILTGGTVETQKAHLHDH